MVRKIIVAIFFGICCVAAMPAIVLADEIKLELKAASSMKDMLTEMTGKRAALRLVSGEELEGTVSVVGNSLVQISRITGKEFYDAVVSIDKISALRVRVREK